MSNSQESTPRSRAAISFAGPRSTAAGKAASRGGCRVRNSSGILRRTAWVRAMACHRMVCSTAGAPASFTALPASRFRPASASFSGSPAFPVAPASRCSWASCTRAKAFRAITASPAGSVRGLVGPPFCPTPSASAPAPILPATRAGALRGAARGRPQHALMVPACRARPPAREPGASPERERLVVTPSP